MDVEIDMAEGQTKRKVGRPKKTDAVSSEFNSYSYRVANSNFWFGFNIFDYYNENELIELVRDPMGHNDMLREISLILYSTNGVYTNTVDYMTAMPTLERVIVSHGKNSEKKRKNKELMSSTLRTIKDKEIVRDALWRGMVEGIAFYYFEVAGTTNDLKKYMSDFFFYKKKDSYSLSSNSSSLRIVRSPKSSSAYSSSSSIELYSSLSSL